MPPARPTAAERALAMVRRNPRRALVLAARAEDQASTPGERARAAWAAGLAHREVGELAEGEGALRRALRAVDAADEPGLVARVMITLALVQAFAGDHAQALATLLEAEPLATEVDRGHLLMQRGIVQYWTGEIAEAVRSYDEARGYLSGRDAEAEARLLVNAGAALTFLGRLDEAERQLAQAEALATANKQPLVAGSAAHNRAHVLALLGRAPEAFEAFDRAEALYRRAALGREYLDVLRLDHGKALLQANLLSEAEAEVSAVLRSAQVSPSTAGEARHVLAQVAMASGDVAAARALALAGRADFERAGRASWALVADSLALSAEAIEHPSVDVAVRGLDAASRFEAFGYRLEATRQRIIAARAAVRAGDVGLATSILSAMAPDAGLAFDRMAWQQVRALCALASDEPGLARRAIRRGLRVFSDNAVLLGAVELRARAAANAEALAGLGTRLAAEDRRPREFLEFIEAARLPATSLFAVRRRVDAATSSALAELRRLADEHSKADVGARREALAAQRAAAERRVGALARRATSSAGRAPSVAEAIGRLGRRALLEFGEVGDEVYVVSVVAGRAALDRCGPAAEIRRLVDGIAHALHRLNRTGLSAASAASARGALAHDGGVLAERLVPRRVVAADAPMLVVPAGPLHGLAWGALGPLRGRAVAVTPSFLAWATADRGGFQRPRRPLLAAGPGLPGARDELDALDALYPESTRLDADDSRVDAVLGALAGCDLAHLACHGAFRRDNPLFSTLTLADGPLTMYDLEGLERLPELFVLSACDAASSSVLAGGALLGLTAGLVAFGARAVVAPLNPVHDLRTAAVMERLHRHLIAGREVDDALAATIAASEGDEQAAAMSFVAVAG